MRVLSRGSAAVRTLLLVLGIVGVVALTACGQGGSATPGSASRGGSVTLVPSPKGPWTINFNPLISGNNSLPGTQGMIYETLLYFNRLDGSIKPWLASSYKWSPDATSLTFTLRPDVKWSDGQPFTSADVLFTLNLSKQYPALDLNSEWQAIQDVSAPDAQTVVVTFKKPAVPMLWYIAGQTYIVPQHIWQTKGDPTLSTNDNPIGTGPFVLKSFNSQLYVMGRNPQYWQQGKPYVDELRYPAYTSNSSADLLLSQGQVDWTGLFTPQIRQTYVNRDPEHNHYWFPPANIVMLYLNTAKAPFNQVAVRQAISTAIDREQIYKTAEAGYEPVAHPTGLILPNESKYLQQEYSGMAYKQNGAQVATLLEKAGFHKGKDGVYEDARGNRLSFKLNVVSGWTDWVTASQIMASNLKAVGIDASVNAVSFNQYISALSQGSFDTSISWTTPGPTPYYLYNALLNSSNTASIGAQATSNFERWNDPTTDKLLAQYAGSIDPTVQQNALNGLQQIMVDQVPSIPLVYGATWYEYNTSRFVGWPDKDHPYAVPAPYSAPDAALVAMNIHRP
jgi:peptide/nickel transport system substrate-binding protein